MAAIRRLVTLLCTMALAVVVPVVPAAAQTPDVRCDFNGDGFADMAAGVRNENIGGARGAGAVQVFYGDADGRLRPVGDDLWHQDDAGILANAGQADQLGSAVACGDFDNDGYGDLAAGVPGETIGGKRAGAVQIFYGSNDGIGRRDALWHQGSDGIKGGPERGDQFGDAVAAGDFDGDGYHDLAVGVPGEGIGGEAGAGAVQVLYGSASGVSARDNLWHQNDRGILANAGARDFFGADVAAGDFNSDGFADLTIGVPGENLRGSGDAGAVHVIYGAADGISRADELWHQADQGIQGGTEPDDAFGNAVSAADFDNDGADDLIAGIPGEDIGNITDAGAVQVIYGSSDGLTSRDDLWHQNDRGIAANAGARDQFGTSVDAGDFDGDGFPDLATGVIGEAISGHNQAGAVHVIYGASDGLTTRDQLWHQDDRGVGGAAESGDLFGFDVFAADFDGDGSDDLAAGVAGEGVAGSDRAGAFQTLYGGEDLLTSRGELWHQGDRGVAGAPQDNDHLGWSTP